MPSSSDENGPGIAIQGPDPAFGWLHGQKEQPLECKEMRPATPFTDDGNLDMDLALPAPADVYPMHEHFYFPADNIYFLVSTCCIYPHSALNGRIWQVGGVLYSVHRYFFERDSSSFTGQGLSKNEPMVLADISTQAFDLFLSILYPR